jgi:hypothetical protein
MAQSSETTQQQQSTIITSTTTPTITQQQQIPRPPTTIPKVNNTHYLFTRAAELKDGQFLACIIMRRKKDNPTMRVPHEIVMHLNIDTSQDAIDKFERAKAICDALNARFYMRIDVRSYKKVAFEACKDIVDRLAREDYKHCLRSISHAIGVSRDSDEPKLFMLDVDRPYVEEEEEQLRKFVHSAQQQNGKQEIKPTIVLRTVNGWHLLCTPFNKTIKRPEAWMNEVDIKVDADTLLYAP